MGTEVRAVSVAAIVRGAGPVVSVGADIEYVGNAEVAVTHTGGGKEHYSGGVDFSPGSRTSACSDLATSVVVRVDEQTSVGRSVYGNTGNLFLTLTA